MIKKVLNVVFRIVFSWTMITFLLLVMQVGLIVASFLRLSDSTIAIVMRVLTIIGTFLIVYIVNKDENPYYKLAWVILIFVVPVLGAVLYLFVELNLGNMGMKVNIRQRLSETRKYLQTDPTTLRMLEECDPQTAGLSRYVERVAGYPTHTGTSVRYFPLGEDKFRDLLADLEEAKEYIFLEYFIIKQGFMWDSILNILKRKAAEGVEVRLMYDGMCSLLLLPYSYTKKLEAFGIRAKMFSPIIPMLSTHQNNRDHRKIVVIDGRVAYTGGINLADEYINRITVFGHWKDNAVRLEGSAVKSFTAMFLQMWNVSGGGEKDYGKYLNREYPSVAEFGQGLVIPYGDVPTDNQEVAETVYMDILNRAVTYVHIMTPYLILDNEMMNALRYAARRGVEVVLILPHIPDKKIPFAIARTYYPALLSAGVKLYEYTPGFVHAKSFVSDDEIAVVGSINLDYRSLYLHFECAAYIYKNPAVLDAEADFQDTLLKCREVTMEYYRGLGIIGKLAGRVLRLLGPLM